MLVGVCFFHSEDKDLHIEPPLILREDEHPSPTPSVMHMDDLLVIRD